MTIRVNNLPSQVTKADLTQLFSEYGSVQEIELFENENTASITLNGDQEEEAAISALSGTEWRGSILELELESGSRDPGGPPGGSGGSGSGGSSSGGSSSGGSGSRDIGGPPH